MGSERTQRAEMLLGGEAIEKLNRSHVAVFGLGGVGSWCAEALARAGVGRMTLVDGDVVSVTNINRQLVALASTVGRPKTEVMAERLRDINPDIVIHERFAMYLPETREEFFTPPPDLIVDAIDTVSSKLDLIVTAKERGIEILSSLGTGNKLDPSRFRMTDIYSTSVCPLARVMRYELKKRGVKDLRVLFSDEQPRSPLPLEQPQNGRRSVPGSVSWVPPSAGLMLAGEAVKLLVGGFDR